MTSYDYFFREELPLAGGWQQQWDIFVSSWDKSDRVRRVFDHANAAQKLWLIHPEYHLTTADMPTNATFEVAGDEATAMQAVATHISHGRDFLRAKVCVDITGMMRPHIAALTKVLKLKGLKKFDAIYSLPDTYVKQEYTTFSSGHISDVREIRGFAGINTPGTDEVLIVAPGFDDALLQAVMRKKEHSKKKIFIFTLPSLRPDMFQHNVLKTIAGDTPWPSGRDLRFASASDPFAVATELSEIVHFYRKSDFEPRFYIAPLATKVQMLGAALFHLTECDGKPISLLYPIVSEHASGTSEGVSKIWLNVIDFDLAAAIAVRAH